MQETLLSQTQLVCSTHDVTGQQCHDMTYWVCIRPMADVHMCKRGDIGFKGGAVIYACSELNFCMLWVQAQTLLIKAMQDPHHHVPESYAQLVTSLCY